ncbi:hypothetical protein Tsubulata_038838 [Turnera subulata]|uniref:Uncharacterized protein n=1 Tax=Turnera subulata TaxID=218843 RepID=A0A9Q0GH83_9ROSI|nr:hypothetical protein Tsubulata_038838 [Turnera subulata]
MADSPSNSSSSSPGRERKKKLRHDDALGLQHHAAVDAISKPNQEEADLDDVDVDDSDSHVEEAWLADNDCPRDLEKGRSPESVTERRYHQYSSDEEEAAEPDSDEKQAAEPDSDEKEAAEPDSDEEPNQEADSDEEANQEADSDEETNHEADSVAPDDCNLDIRKWWFAYEKTLAANADEEESDPEEAVADADEEESDPEAEAKNPSEEEAEAKNPSEEEAEPVEEKRRREYIPEEFTPLLDKYMEQLALHHGFEVNLKGIPDWLQLKLVHPINFNHPFHKPIVDGICRGVCAFANKIQKKELEFVGVLRANREGQIEYRYYITFEARDRLDTSDGENGTIKTYQSRAFVRIRALEKSQRLSLRITVESLDTVPPTHKPALC